MTLIAEIIATLIGMLIGTLLGLLIRKITTDRNKSFKEITNDFIKEASNPLFICLYSVTFILLIIF